METEQEAPGSMRIIELRVQNIMRCVAVSVRPDGALIQITGKNKAGKSSYLDSMLFALSGKRHRPPAPLREGAEVGEVFIDLGTDLGSKYLVTWRCYLNGKEELFVTSPEGAKYGSPQKLLSSFLGDLTFDPIAFSEMGAAAQIKVLKQLGGLDFTDMDLRAIAVYDRRTLTNGKAKDLEAQVVAITEYPDAPDQEVSISELLNQQAIAMEKKSANDFLRTEAETAVAAVALSESQYSRHVEDANHSEKTHKAEIDRLRDELRRQEELLSNLVSSNAEAGLGCQSEVNGLSDEADELAKKVEGLVDPDIDAIAEKIEGAEETNIQVRCNQTRDTLRFKLQEARDASIASSAVLVAIKEDKKRQIAQANLPVEGLGFDDDHVILNGLPFSQASTSEQLSTSVAIGAALNPKLGVMRIKNGSLLDSDSLAEMEKQAEKMKVQIWVEKVTDGEDIGIVIEDGRRRE